MPGLKIAGICRITRDPEVFKTKNMVWLHMGLVAYRKNPREGQQAEDFFSAEYCMRNPESGEDKLMTKGKLIYLEHAELRADKFLGRDGKDRTKTKVLIYAFSYLDEKLAEKTEPKPLPKSPVVSPKPKVIEEEFPKHPPF